LVLEVRKPFILVKLVFHAYDRSLQFERDVNFLITPNEDDRGDNITMGEEEDNLL